MIEKEKLPLNSAIALRIKKIRKQKGYSQEEIGKKVSISQKHVSDYEIGRLRLSVEVLIKFANALEIDISQLIKNGESKKDTQTIDPKWAQRMRKIETLPPTQQKMIVKTIDALVKAAEK